MSRLCRLQEIIAWTIRADPRPSRMGAECTSPGPNELGCSMLLRVLPDLGWA